jgi:DnaJ-domain-containing protein 1
MHPGSPPPSALRGEPETPGLPARDPSSYLIVVDPLVRRLGSRNVAEALRRTPFLMVRVDRAPSFQEGFAEFLDASFPGLLGFGTLERAEVHPDVLTSTFQTAAGPLRRGVTDGYYLFNAGLVIGQHGGQVRPTEFVDPADAEDEALRARVARALGRHRPEVVEAVRALAVYFVPIIERKQQAGGAAWDDPYLGRTGSTPPATARVARPGPDDPYGMLELTPSATDDEVRAAYRAQLMLNHPDRVAHLSPALQQFARQQVLAIHAAYAAITKLRKR